MPRQAAAVAFYTLLEGLRNRLVWLAVLAGLAGVAASMFLRGLAVAEGAQIQVVLLAAFLRLAGVFITAVFVVTTMTREFHDQAAALVLSLPLSRAAYLCGKLAGFMLAAAVIGVLFALLAALPASGGQWLPWGLSLICELWIVAAFSLLCALTFNQIAAALGASLGFYLLARTIAVVQLMAHTPLMFAHTASHRFIVAALDAVAFALPRLDEFTRSEWLV
ncbi:MAG TPA: hypothetical protein DEP05_09725, partial [Betaproteobacteria bacterium]|nr:hypothetical protein [Betaproteobacteria bacterium]